MHEHHHEHHDHHHDVDTADEAKTLLEYMYNHNVSHTNELDKLALKLKQAGNDQAYSEVMLAKAEYEKGNAHLAAALGKDGE